mgnify:CR=1 FL=1
MVREHLYGIHVRYPSRELGRTHIGDMFAVSHGRDAREALQNYHGDNFKGKPDKEFMRGYAARRIGLSGFKITLEKLSDS